MIEGNLASKQDVEDVREKLDTVQHKLERDIADVRDELKRDLAETRRDLEAKIEGMGQTLTIRLGAMLVVAVGVLAGMKFFG